MSRYMRNTAILAKKEVTYGTDAVPSGAANGMLVANCTINPLVADNQKRDLVRPYMGGSEELTGAAYVELSFEVEIAGSGAAGTAPPYGSLLCACGFAETESAGVRTEYNLVTPVDDSVTIYYYMDGVRHIARGCRGDVSLKMNSGGKPVFAFKFLGLDGGIAAAVPGAVDFSSFVTPLVVCEANTGDLTFGCTYTAATPTLTGGTGYPSKGIEIALGNKVSHVPLLGGESIDVGDRDVSGKIMLELTAAQEVTFMATVKANSTQSFGLMHGTTAGNRVMVFGPAGQLTQPTKQDVSGKLMIGFDVRIIPSAGNDELKIVVY